MENTKIEWATHTFNPWIGCTQVSPGCLHCYAETRDKRHLIEKVDHSGKGAPRLRTSPANWRKPLQWNRETITKCSICGDCYSPLTDFCRSCGIAALEEIRPRVFCASLADWLDDEVPIEWLADLLKLIHDTPNLDWLLLTKRPENWEKRLRQAAVSRQGRDFDCTKDPAWILCDRWLPWNGLRPSSPPENIWIGTTVEDQTRADKRIPELLKIPARVRFLSCEPLLGPVNLNKIVLKPSDSPERGKPDVSFSALHGWHGGVEEGRSTIHWVICGGESGAGARPMHPNWARSIRDQCVSAGVAFHFKQWGEFVDNDNMPPETECPEDAGFGAFPDGATVWCVGKRWAGRLLDGREWNEVPT